MSSLLNTSSSASSNLLSSEELSFYNRHLILPSFGQKSQELLKKSKVLVVGAGGLGSPVLLYLAAAGVGKLGVIDFDKVEISNLHRQIIFGVEDVGLSKVEAAARRIRSVNPFVEVATYCMKLNSSNALDILTEYDVVVDGTDNFPTRYLINDSCVLVGKPWVYASIFQFEGQVSVFNYTSADGQLGPDYRDLYPQPPSPGLVLSCEEGGVLGVLPGIIGSMQSNEVIKLITGVGEVLSGRLFVYDALSIESRVFQLCKRENSHTITELIDYDFFCGMKSPVMKEISAEELLHWQKEKRDFQLIDVRESGEYSSFNIGGTLIPLGTIEEKRACIERTKAVVICCESGGRSARAIQYLQEQYGFENLINLRGGVSAARNLPL